MSGQTVVAGGTVAAYGGTVMVSSGSNFGDDIRSIAERIGNGHSWTKHVENKGEFGGVGGQFSTQEDFVDYIQSVMDNPSETRELMNGRTAYWDDTNQAVVIYDPNNVVDSGTAMQPTDGKDYFDNLK